MAMELTESITQDIVFIHGDTNIILVAPNAHKADEENTGRLVRLMTEKIGCHAIINETYQKPAKFKNPDKKNHRVDLNHIDQVKNHLKKDFLDQLLNYKNKIKNIFGNVLIFWIHGAENQNILKDSRSQSLIAPGEIKILIGYGQDSEQPRNTALDETAIKLYHALNNNGLPALMADASIRLKNETKLEQDREKNYCGWHEFNMNQLFAKKDYDDGHTKYIDEYVQSIQLQIRIKDCRDSNKNLESTSQALVRALNLFVEKKQATKEPGSLVENAYSTLFNLFSRHYESAMMDAGRYIIKTFYGNDIEKARNNESTQKKTLNQLYKKIDENRDANSPSRSKLYHAKNLVVQEYDLKNSLSTQDFSTLRNLSLSHKIYLLSVKELKEKKYWINKILSEQLTIKQLQAKKGSVQSKEPTPKYLINHPEEIWKEKNKNIFSFEDLKKHPPEKLKEFKKNLDLKKNDFEKEIQSLAESINSYEKYLKEFSNIKSNIEKAIQYKEEA